MSAKRSKKSLIIFLYGILSFAIVLLCFVSDTFTNEETWFSFFAILVLLSATLQFFSLKKYVNFLSVTNIFLLLTYCFHFGLILNMGLFSFFKPEMNLYYVYNLSFEPFKKAAGFCLVSVLSFGLGILSVGKPKILSKNKNLVKISKRVFWFGVILILIGVPFIIEQLIDAIKVFLNGSYLDSFDAVGDGSGIKSFLSNFFYAGIACLITYYSRNKKSKAIIVLFVSAVILIFNILFTGGRGRNLLMLVVLSLVAFYNNVFKFSRWKIVLLTVFAYLGVVVLNTVADVRMQGMQIFGSSFLNNLGGFALLDILQEMGSSIYTPYLCVLQRGNEYQTAWGRTYIYSLITIMPNLNGVFTEYINASSFVKALDGVALGGSFIGETFFNFGYLGIIVTFLIGIVVYKLDLWFKLSVIKGNATNIAFCIPIICTCLWWVRDASNGFVREIVWGAIILLCVWKVVQVFYFKDDGRNKHIHYNKVV